MILMMNEVSVLNRLQGDQVRYQPIGPHPVSYVDFSADYPRFPKIQSVTVAEDDMDLYMSLKPCKYT